MFILTISPSMNRISDFSELETEIERNPALNVDSMNDNGVVLRIPEKQTYDDCPNRKPREVHRSAYTTLGQFLRDLDDSKWRISVEEHGNQMTELHVTVDLS